MISREGESKETSSSVVSHWEQSLLEPLCQLWHSEALPQFICLPWGSPACPLRGSSSTKFPLPAMGQRSFSLDLGTLHCSFLSQPTTLGPQLQETGCLMKRFSLSGSSGYSVVPGVLQLRLEPRNTWVAVNRDYSSHCCTVL